jgi:glycosyltransferase involved in cell wall biosynthesis
VTSFSFVIPAFDEEDDIDRTLRAVLDLVPSAWQVIVVDDGSRDSTAERIRAWADDGVQLMHHSRNLGLAAARNTGVEAATGDVVVFLDADDEPARTLLADLEDVYATGADCVSLESRVRQPELLGRYADADHAVKHGARDGFWTAGFSCQTAKARVIPFDERLKGSGEDVHFFGALIESGAQYRHVPSIVVNRRVPVDWKGFWAQWHGRGRGVPFFDIHVRGLGPYRMLGRRLLGAMRDVVAGLLIFPLVIASARRASRSPRGLRDFFGFLVAVVLQHAAQRSGELGGAMLFVNPSRSDRTHQEVVRGRRSRASAPEVR